MKASTRSPREIPGKPRVASEQPLATLTVHAMNACLESMCGVDLAHSDCRCAMPQTQIGDFGVE